MMKLNRLNVMSVLLYLWVGPILTFTCGTEPDDDDESGDGLNWISTAGNDVDTTNYYVSPNGNDNANGKSLSTPFRTIARAIQSVHPGGTIRILPGTYNEAIGIMNSGNEAATITVTGHQDIPVLDGQARETMGFFCENCKNFIFSHLQIQNYTDVGIGATQSKDMTLRRLIVKENGHAVQLKDWEFEGYGIHVEESEGVIITDNNVYRNGPDPQIIPTYLMGTGIEISDEDLQKPHGYILENNRSTRNYYGIFIWNFGTTDWPDSTILRRSGNQFTDNSRQDVWIVDWF